MVSRVKDKKVWILGSEHRLYCVFQGICEISMGSEGRVAEGEKNFGHQSDLKRLGAEVGKNLPSKNRLGDTDLS